MSRQIVPDTTTRHTPNVTDALQTLSRHELTNVYCRALDQITLSHYAGGSDAEVGFWRVVTRAAYAEMQARKPGPRMYRYVETSGAFEELES